MFQLATKMSLDSSLERKLYWRLALAYKYQLLRTKQRIYLDKTHQNIWIAEKLKKTFPNALFIGIERNPYATVASMLKHEDVRSWHDKWQSYPVPNTFLGIASGMESHYESLSLASRCALRWRSHATRMSELRNTLGNNLYVISYEDFALDTQKTITTLQSFMDLKVPLPVPIVTVSSLNKWRTSLSTDDVKQIQEITGIDPDSAA